MHCFASFNFPPLHIIKLGLDVLKYEPFTAHSFHYMPTPIKGVPRAWCQLLGAGTAPGQARCWVCRRPCSSSTPANVFIPFGEKDNCLTHSELLQADSAQRGHFCVTLLTRQDRACHYT